MLIAVQLCWLRHCTYRLFVDVILSTISQLTRRVAVGATLPSSALFSLTNCCAPPLSRHGSVADCCATQRSWARAGTDRFLSGVDACTFPHFDRVAFPRFCSMAACAGVAAETTRDEGVVWAVAGAASHEAKRLIVADCASRSWPRLWWSRSRTSLEASRGHCGLG